MILEELVAGSLPANTSRSLLRQVVEIALAELENQARRYPDLAEDLADHMARIRQVLYTDLRVGDRLDGRLVICVTGTEVTFAGDHKWYKIADLAKRAT